LSINITRSGVTAQEVTYFWKVCIVDTEGQEFVLSEAARNGGLPDDTSYPSSSLWISCLEKDIAHFYRAKKINVYRAYASTSDAIEPITNYKLLYSADINFEI